MALACVDLIQCSSGVMATRRPRSAGALKIRKVIIVQLPHRAIYFSDRRSGSFLFAK